MKTPSKPFAKYSAAHTIFRMFFTSPLQKNLIPLFKSVIKNFFIIQQKQKLHITDIPVVHVDHHLDAHIPFTPKKVKIYLDFIWFIARSMDMLFKNVPKEQAIQIFSDFENFVQDLYTKAGEIYSKTLSTTERPSYFKTPRFIIIHAFDPHLLCVPSLHVALVAGTWAFMRQALKSTNLENYEIQKILNELFFGAIKITESVLYVKQHSINCVAAAFYILTASYNKDFFTKEDTKYFIEKLFEDSPDVFPSDILEIQNYMLTMYSSLLEKQKKEKNWKEPLLEWLKNYKS